MTGVSRIRLMFDMVRKQLSPGASFDALIVCGDLEVAETASFLDDGDTIPLPVYYFSSTKPSHHDELLLPLPTSQVNDILGLRVMNITSSDTAMNTEHVDIVISDVILDTCHARYLFCTTDKYIVHPTEENKPKIICLAPGGDPVERYLHALNIEPAQQPPTKRQKTQTPSEDRVVFIANLPYQATQAGMELALRRIFKPVGPIDSIRLNVAKGLAWVTFPTAQAAQSACCLPAQSLNNRQLRIQPSRPFKNETAPQADCWFCLGNEDFEARYVVAASLEAYAVLAKGGITPYHTVIASVQHLSNWSDADNATSDRIEEYTRQLQVVADEAGEDIVIFERWLPMKSIEFNHLQVNIVPVPKDVDFSRVIAELSKHAVAAESIDQVRSIVGSPAQPYLWVRLPSQSFLCRGRLPVQLARELLCEALGCNDRVNWRDCIAEAEVEDERIEFLRRKLNP